jgi:hypothetical protein
VKFQSGDMVMLISLKDAAPHVTRILAVGFLGTIDSFCEYCTLQGLVFGQGGDRYHVRFSAGQFSVPEYCLKKIDGDPDEEKIETEEEVAA